jgi:hypothetical protein
MNNGFFGFSASAYGSSVISVTEFDSSATYQIPNGAKRLWIMLIGAGGGGGSGARQGTGVNSYGGGGGAGGAQNTGYYFVNAIGSTAESVAAANAGFTPGSWGRTLTIAIGAGGTGGASASSDTSSGSNGVDGGASTITLTGTLGFMMYSSGGAFGSGGTTSSGAAGTGQQRLQNGIPRIDYYPNYTSGASGNNAIGTSQVVTQYVNTGGAGGGGVSTGNSASSGGGVQTTSGTTDPTFLDPNITSGNDIKSGGASGTATSRSFSPVTIGNMKYTPGLGGVGGGGSVLTAANNGEAGYRGGGGGGGGGSRNTFASGAGGAGGNGYCVIVALG